MTDTRFRETGSGFFAIMQLSWVGHLLARVVGLLPARMVVIETDGSIKQVDILKVVYQGAATRDCIWFVIC